MAIFIPALQRLELFQSAHLLPVQPIPAGTYIIPAAPYSNSLLSTIWVKSLDPGASISAVWLDTGPGGGDYPGELIQLGIHPAITTADTSHRANIPRFHNKPFVRLEVTGGEVEAGIYITSTNTFPIDPPYFNKQTFLEAIDKGNANVVLASDGKFYISTGQLDGASNAFITGGALDESDVDLKILKKELVSDGTNQELFNYVVPIDKFWRVRKIKIISRTYASFEVLKNADIIDLGVTGPSESNVVTEFLPYLKLEAETVIKLNFKKNFGPDSDVKTIFHYTEHDI